MQIVVLPFHLLVGKFDAVIRTMHKKCQFRIATKQARQQANCIREEAINKWYSVLLDCLRHVDTDWKCRSWMAIKYLEVMFVELMCLCV